MTGKSKKTILAAVGIFVILIVAFCIFVNTGPRISGEDEIFKEIMAEDVPELVTGQTGFARNGKVKIWYESFMPANRPRGTVLLIMGHSATSLRWQDFHLPLVAAGYQVIRFDNRGTGLSDLMNEWESGNPYTLEDMAQDALAVMDALGIGKAHLVGVSMGGMIAQQMAIKHPSRAASLTSIMSSGYLDDPELKILSPRLLKSLIRLAARYRMIPTKMNMIKFQVYLYYCINNCDPSYDARKSAELARYELEKHGGDNTKVVKQHNAAIKTSGSRYGQLASIKAPTLIIHGKEDGVIPIEHAYKYAAMIPGATTLFIDGMGHGIVAASIKKIEQAILQNIR